HLGMPWAGRVGPGQGVSGWVPAVASGACDGSGAPGEACGAWLGGAGCRGRYGAGFGVSGGGVVGAVRVAGVGRGGVMKVADDVQLALVNGWLVEVVDEHTCGTGPEGYY